MAKLKRPFSPKDPDAVLPYEIDWEPVLGATYTIDTSVWIPPVEPSNPPTITNGAGGNGTISADAKKVIVVLSGGEAGKKYTFVNRVTFGGASEYSDDLSVTWTIKES